MLQVYGIGIIADELANVGGGEAAVPNLLAATKCIASGLLHAPDVLQPASLVPLPASRYCCHMQAWHEGVAAGLLGHGLRSMVALMTRLPEGVNTVDSEGLTLLHR